MIFRNRRLVRPYPAQRVSAFVVAGVVAVFVLQAASPAIAATPAVVEVSASVLVSGTSSPSATVASGSTVQEVVNYRCSASDCTGATITIPFPADLQIGTAQIPGDVASQSRVGNTLTLTMIDPLPAGSTGQISIPVTVPAWTTLDAATSAWNATMAAGNAPTATSATQTITSHSDNTTSATASQSSGGATDQPTKYTVGACVQSSGTTGYGPLAIADGSRLVATLPEGATYTTSTGSGLYDVGSGTVTWTVPQLQGCTSYQLTVVYPSTDPSNTTDTVKTLAVSWRGHSLGAADDDALGKTTTTTTLVVPQISMSFDKWSYTSSLAVGESMNYFLTATNTGNITADTVEINDEMPAQMKTTHISVTNPSDSAGQLWISSLLGPDGIAGTTDDNQLILAATVAAGNGANTDFDPYSIWPSGAAALRAGDIVKQVQIRLNDVAPSAGGNVAGITATPMPQTLDGTPVSVGDTITNTATFDAAAAGQAQPQVTKTKTVTVAPQIPLLGVRDSGPGTLANGQRTGDFTVSTGVSNFPFPNPVFIHLLPVGVTQTSWSHSDSTLPEPTLTSIDNWQGLGRTLERWTFPAGTTIPVNSNYSITSYVKLDATAWGTLTDEGYVSSSTIEPRCDFNFFGSGPDTDDKDGDGNTTETLCKWNASISPAPSSSASITTSAKGSYDSSYVTSPGTSDTTPGSSTDTYKVAINNTGTVQLNHAIAIDVLPRAGDTQELSDIQRNPTTRTFPVILRALPIVPTLASPVTVSYSIAVVPCLTELSHSAVGCADAAWSATPPANLAEVTAVKIDYGDNLIDPFTSVTATLPVTTPTMGASEPDYATFNPDPTDPADNERAINTAAFIATRADLGSTLLPAESQGVTFEVPSIIGVPGNPPTADDLTSTGIGTTPQTATADVPVQGSASLLIGTGTPVTTLTVTDVGTYSIDQTSGVITFTPVLGFTGTAPAIGYQLTDGFGQTGNGTFTATVTAPAAPTAPALTTSGTGTAPESVDLSPATGSTASLLQGGAAVTTITIPGKGTFADNTDTGKVTFTPVLGFAGTASTTYRITDAYGQSAVGTITATVSAPAEPTATNVALVGTGTTPETATVIIPSYGSVTLLDGTTPVSTLQVTGVGTYTVNRTSGMITFTAQLGYIGTATPVSYQVTDAYGQTATAMIITTVTAPPAPTAGDVQSVGAAGKPQSTTTTVPTGGSVTLLDGTTQINTLTIPGEGTYTVAPRTGVITFTPIPGFTGTATAANYRITDAYEQTATGAYTAIVTPAGILPTAGRTPISVPGTTDAAPTPTGNTLPYTGSNDLPLTLRGLILLLAGLVTVRLSRRRRHQN